MINCPICNGKGYQDETIKGFRRYKCWSCEGKKQIKQPTIKHEEKNTHQPTQDSC